MPTGVLFFPPSLCCCCSAFLNWKRLCDENWQLAHLDSTGFHLPPSNSEHSSWASSTYLLWPLVFLIIWCFRLSGVSNESWTYFSAAATDKPQNHYWVFKDAFLCLLFLTQLLLLCFRKTRTCEVTWWPKQRWRESPHWSALQSTSVNVILHTHFFSVTWGWKKYSSVGCKWFSPILSFRECKCHL